LEKSILLLTDAAIPVESLLSVLHTDEENESIDDIRRMHREAAEIAKPVAIYAPFIPDIRDGVISINDIIIEEPFVYQMLSDRGLVIPYAATCGTELDAWSRSYTDMYDQYIADSLKALYLNAVLEKLTEEVRSRYFNNAENISSINPGSLEQWPIKGQIQLFNILGGVTADTGVELTESLLMIPNKSVSGIFFRSEDAYHNCQLCLRENCPNRRVPYSG